MTTTIYFKLSPNTKVNKEENEWTLLTISYEHRTPIDEIVITALERQRMIALDETFTEEDIVPITKEEYEKLKKGEIAFV